MGIKTESTIYVKGLRKRTESGSMMGITTNPTIEQCDLQRTITLNIGKKLYYIEAFSKNEEEVIDEDIKTVPKKTTPVVDKTTKKGGTITMYFSIVDTGERKNMYGFTARHIWTSQKMKPSPDACSMKDSIQIKTDGWYIDLPQFNCPVRYSSYKPTTTSTVEKPDCQDKFITRRSGRGKLGFPLIVKTTMILGDGSGKTTEFETNLETVELTSGKLDSMLFEIPPGFTEAKSLDELKEKVDYKSMIKQVKEKAVNDGLMKAEENGKILIGVYVPTGEEGLKEYGTSIQNHIVSQLNNSVYAAIAVTGPDDAKAKKCEYTLGTDFQRYKQSSKVGGLLKAVKNADPGAASSFNIDLSMILNRLSDGSTKLSEKVSGKFEGKGDESAKRSVEEGCGKLLSDLSR